MDLRQIVKNITVKNTYSQNAVLIFLSKGIIILFTFGITPIIARLYTPEQYGTYALLNSIVIVFSLISTWSLPSELIISGKDQLDKLVKFILQLSLICSLIFTFCLLFLKDWLFRILSLELDSNYLLIIPLYVVVISISEIFASLNIREKNYKTNILVNATDNISNKSITLMLGVLKLTYLGLIVGDIFGKTLNVIVQSIRYKGNLFKNISFRKYLKFNQMADLMRTYSNYWKFQLPSLFIQRFSNQLIIWLLAIFFSKANLGQFTMGVSLLSIPLLLFSNSFQPIITSKLAEMKGSGMIAKAFDNTVVILSMVSFVVYVLIFLVCDWFIPIYLSDKWLGSIIFIKILCFSYFMTLIGNSISGLYIVFGQQRLNFHIKMFFSIMLFAALSFCLAKGFTLTIVIGTYSLVIFVEEVIRIVLLRKAVARNIK